MGFYLNKEFYLKKKYIMGFTFGFNVNDVIDSDVSNQKEENNVTKTALDNSDCKKIDESLPEEKLIKTLSLNEAMKQLRDDQSYTFIIDSFHISTVQNVDDIKESTAQKRCADDSLPAEDKKLYYVRPCALPQNESNSDLIAGKYEGGLKIWECSVDLLKFLLNQKGGCNSLFSGKRVLELGCGVGLPGMLAAVSDAAFVTFQDFNDYVIEKVTAPSLLLNLWNQSRKKEESLKKPDFKVPKLPPKKVKLPKKIRRSSEDYSDESSSSSEDENVEVEDKDSLMKEVIFGESAFKTDPGKYSFASGDWAEFHVCNDDQKFDVILTSETIYDVENYEKLHACLKRTLNPDGGVVYLASKSFYFGVGGGVNLFTDFLRKKKYFTVANVHKINVPLERNIMEIRVIPSVVSS